MSAIDGFDTVNKYPPKLTQTPVDDPGHVENHPLKLLSKGRILTDPERDLNSYGVLSGSKVVVMLGRAPEAGADTASTSTNPQCSEQRIMLDRLVSAADKLCSRTVEDGLQHSQIVLEDQVSHS